MPGVVTAGRVVDDRYRLLEAIEEGGMGILWRAEDLISERYVTVKELRFPDPLNHMQRRALAARVRREARAMASVEHPGLAHIVDVVDDGDRPWVVTELIEAPTLAQVVVSQGPMSPEATAAMGLRLLDVLEAAHEQEMVHRFLQPSKVFVSDPTTGEVRVTDFGISSLIGDPTVASNGNVGGVSFMAPEQAGTAEADVWSLGAILYYAVEGAAPFSGDTPTAILMSMATERPRTAVRARALAAVLDATLVADPAGRTGADELRNLLTEVAGPLADDLAPDDVDDGGEPTQAADAIVWPDSADDDATALAALDADEVDPGASLSFSAPGPAENGSEGPPPADNHAPGDPGVEAPFSEAPFSEAGATNGQSAAEVQLAEVPPAAGVPDDQATDTTAEVAPAAENGPPPAPLAPREALARMFSPDPGRPPPPEDSSQEAPGPPNPWPLRHKRSLLTVGLCTLVMAVMVVILITNGRSLFSSESPAAQALATVKWQQYTDPEGAFRIDYPSEWIVTHEGIYTDFRHPTSAAALRVVTQPSTARSSEQGWLELETRFQLEQPGYRRIRLESIPFRGLDGAEWEFAYTKADAGGHSIDLHNIDLGVVTGKSAFALNFETRATNWGAVQPFFERFKSTFRPSV